LSDAPGAPAGAPAKVRRLLAELPIRPLNFDPGALAEPRPQAGWKVTELSQALPDEPAGAPILGGSFEIARRLMRSYAFADPSSVRAYYDRAVPLGRRNMVLKLQALRLLHLYVGVRVGEVYERTAECDDARALVWGWNYRTLEGHVEEGQMDWQVWKWLDDGRVEFRVHAVARRARIDNPLVRAGFALLAPRERAVFLQSTQRRMRAFVEAALAEGDRPIRDIAAKLTARPASDGDPAHEEIAANLREPGR
jgi:uncharacterized protein (UPF0548 family)